MSKLKTLFRLLRDGSSFGWVMKDKLAKARIFRILPDNVMLSAQYYCVFGKRINLNNPVTFNEKLQWLKLYDRNPLYQILVDKLAVKQWVSDKIGVEYIVKTYATWDSVDAIDLDILPDKFVLKTNHDSGGVAICRDKSVFDFEGAKKKLNVHMKSNLFWHAREWPYKSVKPCVFAEEYLEPNEAKGLIDYKFMCFNGSCRCAFTCTGRADGNLRVDFFDNDWTHMPFTRHYPNADIPPERPRNLRQMQSAAETLSQDIPFVRVDFYEVGESVYFGEMTFYPGAGFEEFNPSEWDERLGSWMDLSKVHNK